MFSMNIGRSRVRPADSDESVGFSLRGICRHWALLEMYGKTSPTLWKLGKGKIHATGFRQFDRVDDVVSQSVYLWKYICLALPGPGVNLHHSSGYQYR